VEGSLASRAGAAAAGVGLLREADAHLTQRRGFACLLAQMIAGVLAPRGEATSGRQGGRNSIRPLCP